MSFLRNVDLHRDILLQLRTGGRDFAITGYPEEDFHEAADELRQDGYILATTAWIHGDPYEYVMPRQLTEKGQALAWAIESDLVWAQVKQWLPRPEDRVSLEVIRKVAEKVKRMQN